MTKLSSVIQVRVSPELREAIWEEANRLKLKPAEVMRFAIARLCAGDKHQTVATGGANNYEEVM